MESYRTARGPRQRVVAWLGGMDEQGRLGVKRCAERQTAHQPGLFEAAEPEWVEVDLKRVRVERSRKFGGPWLGLELLRRLELDQWLEHRLPGGREEIPWAVMARVLVLGRLCDPSSELHLAERFYECSALADLLGVPAEKVNDDRLYRALQEMVAHMEGLYGRANRIGVLDRGMVSEDNVEFLREGGRRYIVGTPKNSLKKFEQELLAEDWRQVHAGLEVRLVSAPGGTAAGPQHPRGRLVCGTGRAGPGRLCATAVVEVGDLARVDAAERRLLRAAQQCDRLERCGRRWRNYAGKRAWATSRARSSRRFRKSRWWT